MSSEDSEDIVVEEDEEKEVAKIIDQRVNNNQTECLVKYKGKDESDAYETYCGSQEFVAKEILQEAEDGNSFLVRWEKQVEPTWEDKSNIDDCEAYEKYIAGKKRKREEEIDSRPRKVKIVRTTNKLPTKKLTHWKIAKKFKIIKTERTAPIAAEPGGFSESEEDDDSDEPIFIKKKSKKMKLKAGTCENCGPTESVRFTRGLCSACYQKLRKEESISVKKELAEAEAKRIKVKEEFNNKKKCSNCFTRETRMWRGDVCDRCFKKRIQKKVDKKNSKKSKAAGPVPESWKRQAREKKRASEIKRAPPVPDSWKTQAQAKRKANEHISGVVKRKKPHIREVRNKPAVTERVKKRPPPEKEIEVDSEASPSPPPVKKKKPAKVKVKPEGASKSRSWTEDDFYTGIAMLKEGSSWSEIAKAIGNVEPDRVEKYFKKFKTMKDPIYQQQSQFNFISWNRPAQKWLVNCYGEYINRYATEDEAAACADAVCINLDPEFKAHNLLPKSEAEVKEILATIPNYQKKRVKMLNKTSFKNRNNVRKPKAGAKKKKRKRVGSSETGARKRRKLDDAVSKRKEKRKAVKPEPTTRKMKSHSSKKKAKINPLLDSESSDSEAEVVIRRHKKRHMQHSKKKKTKVLREKAGNDDQVSNPDQNLVLDDDLFPELDFDDEIDAAPSIPKPTPPTKPPPPKPRRKCKILSIISRSKIAKNGVKILSIPKKKLPPKKRLVTTNKLAIPKKPSGAPKRNPDGTLKKFPDHWKDGIAFTPEDNVLICAECDWQFTLSLAKGLRTGKRIVATCYKEATDVPTKYGSAFDRRGDCERLGVTIVEYVDITNPEILQPVIRKNFKDGNPVRVVVPFILHSHSSSREMNRMLMRGLFKSLKQTKRIYQVDLILHRKKMSGDGQFEYWNVKNIADREGFEHLRGYKMLFKESGKVGGESCDFPGYYPSSETGERIFPNFPQLGYFHTFRRKRQIPIDEMQFRPNWIDDDGTTQRHSYKTTVRVTDPDQTEYILENRENNRNQVERKLKLHEFGMHPDMCLILNKKGDVLFKGYERIVYGDHGPYLEFLKHNVMFDKFGEELPGNYYNRRHPKNSGEKIKLYCQKRTVSDRPNPPKGGQHSVNNDRPEGYADYRPGRFYVDPLCWHLRFIFPCPRKKNVLFLENIRARKSSDVSKNSLPLPEKQGRNGFWPPNQPIRYQQPGTNNGGGHHGYRQVHQRQPWPQEHQTW